jgi:hypothetical protein
VKRLLLPLALAVLAASPANAAPPNRAAEVFEQVCVDGGGQFADGELRSVESGQIPTRARQLAMLALWTSEYNYDDHRFALAEEMPNQVYRLRGDDEIYLALADDDAGNPIQASCLVFVDGNQYRSFAAYAAELAGAELPDLERLNAHVGFRMGDYRINVATLPMRGPTWTMLAATPLQFDSTPEPSE